MNAKLVAIASQEIGEWDKLPRALVMAILFAFIHRVTTGETVEQTFFKAKKPENDFQI